MGFLHDPSSHPVVWIVLGGLFWKLSIPPPAPPHFGSCIRGEAGVLEGRVSESGGGCKETQVTLARFKQTGHLLEGCWVCQ